MVANPADRGYGAIGVWFFRALLLIPFVLMAPEVVSAILGRPGAVANISASVADVLGTSTFLIFVLMLTVTPIRTVTGWRWHLILRRDYGIAMFATAGLDITLAATTTGDTFQGTPLTRVAGHSFLVAGTLSTLLLVPLVITANRPAQQWLGRHWKSVQRVTYAVWAMILVHLFLLFGLTSIFLAGGQRAARADAGASGASLVGLCPSGQSPPRAARRGRGGHARGLRLRFRPAGARAGGEGRRGVRAAARP